MLIDSIEVNSGSLLKDLTPAINPPKEIVDPSDVKPESWDEREKFQIQMQLSQRIGTSQNQK